MPTHKYRDGKKIPKRSRRQFKSTADKEAKFIACLLANGPKPRGPEYYGNGSHIEYAEQIREWWRRCHNSEPAITDKACHRFYNRYTRWLSQQRYHRRRELRTEECIEEARDVTQG
ncbi:hypothetical protein LCGC14_1451580 [marine sediment metagenome]|uniref:Uncharacterized protein n=1 Tax=marine sediment metagenome TaxID=412755 RepID=A0A0F9K429_9ZZZZ